MGPLRNQDRHAEKQLAKFMDIYFYRKLPEKVDFPIEVKRIEDKEEQFKGVDVRIKIGGRELIIDEKASLHYSNAMIPTFAFELDSIQSESKTPVQGWFINDDLETEYYMLIWPNIKCESDKGWIRKNLKSLKYDDFTIIEALLIKKNLLRSELERMNLGKQRLIEYAQKVREMGKTGQKKEIKIFEGVKVMYSGYLSEEPVNLIVGKNRLLSLANAVYLISTDGYATIKERW